MTTINIKATAAHMATTAQSLKKLGQASRCAAIIAKTTAFTMVKIVDPTPPNIPSGKQVGWAKRQMARTARARANTQTPKG